MALRPFARIRMAAITSSYLAACRDQRLKIVSGATVNREFNVLSHATDTSRREWVARLIVRARYVLSTRLPSGRGPAARTTLQTLHAQRFRRCRGRS